MRMPPGFRLLVKVQVISSASTRLIVNRPVASPVPLPSEHAIAVCQPGGIPSWTVYVRKLVIPVKLLVLSVPGVVRPNRSKLLKGAGLATKLKVPPAGLGEGTIFTILILLG